MNSINYYNENSKSFIENTEKADMGRLWQAFENFLPTEALILDVGCGSGRDSRYFLN